MLKPTICMAILLMLVSSTVGAEQSDIVKNANVAGQFYSADPQLLGRHIERLLDQAEVRPLNKHIDVIFVPHAGYVYSGSVAAYSFKAASLNRYSTVIIVGPSHYVATDGVGVWSQGAYKTPLGLASVDEDLAKAIVAIDDRITFRRDVFQKEHSVEVEIPFVQHVFKGAKIVPIVMGHTDPSLVAKLAKGIHNIVKDRKDVLLVISSDLSHYLKEDVAQKLDKAALNAIEDFDAEEIIRNNNKTMAIDGVYPVLLGIFYAKEKNLDTAKVLKYSHSGFVNGDMDRVVGYGAVVYHGNEKFSRKDSKSDYLTNKQKQRLLDISGRTLEYYLKTGKVYAIGSRDRKKLPVGHGAFVSLYNNKQLRGCIGHIESEQSLAEVVRDMTIAAASKDKRFKPVNIDEIDEIDIEISVLSKPQMVDSADDIVLGKHGVIMTHKDKRGVFLPQVADDTGWTKEKFLTVLAVQKAGLAPDAWKNPDVSLAVFTADVFDVQTLK